MPTGKPPDSEFSTSNSADAFEENSVHDSQNPKVLLDPRKDPRRSRATVETASGVSSSTLRESGVVGSGLTPEQVVPELERAVQRARIERFPHPGLMRSYLGAELMGPLRHAVELAGGDGLDAFIAAVVGMPNPRQRDPFLTDVAAAMQRLHAAPLPPAIFAEAAKVIELVRTALAQPSPKKLSVVWLRREFNRNLDLQMVLQILCAPVAELRVQAAQVGQAVENLGGQLRAMAGKHPEALFATFARLKVEKRIVDAELARRSAPK